MRNRYWIWICFDTCYRCSISRAGHCCHFFIGWFPFLRIIAGRTFIARSRQCDTLTNWDCWWSCYRRYCYIIFCRFHKHHRWKAICSKTQAVTLLCCGNSFHYSRLFFMIDSVYIDSTNFLGSKGNAYLTLRLNFFSFIYKGNVQTTDLRYIYTCCWSCCCLLIFCQCLQFQFGSFWEHAFFCVHICCDSIAGFGFCELWHCCFCFALCLRFAFCLYCHSCHIDSSLICQDSFYYIGTCFGCTCRDALVYQHAFYCVTVFDYYIKYDLTVFCIGGRIYRCAIDHDMCVTICCERDRILSHLRSIFIRFRCLGFWCLGLCLGIVTSLGLLITVLVTTDDGSCQNVHRWTCKDHRERQ